MRGIYAGTNILTDTVYYGQSGNIYRRIKDHINHLNNKNHSNFHLQASWNKYGESAFVFAPVEIVEDNTIDLTPIEKKYKDNAYSLGLKIFNMIDPGEPPMLGRHHTTQSNKKNSIAHIGINPPSRKGTTMPLEACQKISMSLVGNKRSVGKNLSNKHALGSKHTDEWKQQESERMKDYWLRRKSQHEDVRCNES